MNRKEGYYWVRQYSTTELEVASWDGRRWWLTGTDCSYIDDEMDEINETQILPPNV